MKKLTVEKHMETILTKRDAVEFIGQLLNGTYVVDVNTGALEEGGSGAHLYADELEAVLLALGVAQVPTDIISKCGNRHAKLTDNDVAIEYVTAKIKTVQQAKGIIASLIDGCTQVDYDRVLIVYGNEPQSYAGAKSVFGELTMEEYAQEYESYWNDVEEDTFVKVNRLVDMLHKE